MLTFDPVAHRYFWDGVPVPNVTRAIAMLTNFDHIPPATLEAARLEGVDIHRMAELHCKGDLDESTLPSWLVPRLDALKKFLADTGFQVVASEQRVYHPLYRYAGTADLFGDMAVPQGRRSVRENVCVDIKRSFFGGRAIGLQLAGYAEAWKAAGNAQIHSRYALQLNDNGAYRLQKFDDRSDFPNFLACLLVHKLKEQMK